MKAGQATVSKLDALTKRRARLTRLRGVIDANLKGVDEQIRELATRYELPNKSGKSESIILPGGGQIRVTRAEYAPTINPSKLLANMTKRLGPQAPELFLQVVTVEKVTINVDKWEAAKERELVRQTDLTSALEQRDPPKPSVVIKEK